MSEHICNAERIYRIVRFRFNQPSRTVRTGLTLAEAQAHCSREDTHGTDRHGNRWFDGYTTDRRSA